MFSQLGIRCCCHALNTILSHIFDREHAGLKNIKDVIKSCKAVVMIAKKTSGMNGFLKTTLKQCVQTRWNSIYITILSVYDNMDRIREWFNSKEALVRRNTAQAREDVANLSLADDLSSIHSMDIIKGLLAILKVFKDVSGWLEGSSYPTIYRVAYAKSRLLERLHAEKERLTNRELKDAIDLLVAKVETIFRLDDMMLAGAFMNPVTAALLSNDQKLSIFIINHSCKTQSS